MSGSRTYRVPKRVQREVLEGLSAYRARGLRLDDHDALQVAEVLTAGHPVDASVAGRITDFFTNDWRFHPQKVRVASLYGGEQGAAWAGKVVSSVSALTAAAAPLSGDELVELTTFTDDDFQMLLEYGRTGAVTAGLSVGRVGDVVVVVVDGDDDDDDDDDHHRHDHGRGGRDVPVVVPAVTHFADGGGGDAESGLVSLAVADAAEFAADDVDADGPSDADAVDGGAVDGAEVGVGSRVRDGGGMLGWVTGHRDGGAVVETDDGRELVVPADEFEVVSVEGRGRLDGPPELIEDSERRLREYLVWAKERMASVTAAGEPAAGTSAKGPSPLFMAEVDSVDTTAVLAVLAVIPTDEGTGLRVFERRDAQWSEASDYVRAIKSVDPPALVELDRETLLTVVEQLDQSDLSGGGEEGEEGGGGPEAAAGGGGAGEGAPPAGGAAGAGEGGGGGPEAAAGGGEEGAVR